MKFKLKNKRKIGVLACLIFAFAMHWIRCYDARERDIEEAKKDNMLSRISEEVRDSKIARAVEDFDETSALCFAAIFIYSVTIVGLVCFDRRESKEEQ